VVNWRLDSENAGVYPGELDGVCLACLSFRGCSGRGREVIAAAHWLCALWWEHVLVEAGEVAGWARVPRSCRKWPGAIGLIRVATDAPAVVGRVLPMRVDSSLASGAPPGDDPATRMSPSGR
jgi:hypothetical protein